MNPTDIICLESKAFYSLVEEVVERIGEKYKLAQQDEWVDGDEAMRLLPQLVEGCAFVLL